MSRFVRATTTGASPSLALLGATAIIAATALIATPKIVHGQTNDQQHMQQQAAAPNAGAPSAPHARHHAQPAKAEAEGEGVEERISQLHAQLKITPDEEKYWNDVAQAMRDNAANMEKLRADKHAKGPQNLTAIDDLKIYQEFAQQHVDGLKHVTSAFETLYDKMPDPQKKVADQVFQNFWRHGMRGGHAPRGQG